jgi:hypothetical protein
MSAREERPPLNVYVVWHPDFADGRALADTLYEALALQPRRVMTPGLGIPVFFRTSDRETRPPAVPSPVDVDRAGRTAVVVLVDENLAGDDAWVAYVRGLADSVLAAREAGKAWHLVLPVLFLERGLAPDLGKTQHIALYDEYEAGRRPLALRLRVTAEVCRLLNGMPRGREGDLKLSPKPLELFVSHAKLDGEHDALDLLRRIADARLDTFFDRQNIAAGHDFADEILGHVELSAVIALQSDAYASRPWCRREVLQAKRHGRPIVVVHLTKTGEDRSFPYLGNVPTLRWTGNNQDEVIAATVREYLRMVYTEARFDWLVRTRQVPAGAHHLVRPPELLDGVLFRRRPTEKPHEAARAEAAEKATEAAAGAAGTTVAEVGSPTGPVPVEVPRQLVLYPDPPLGNEEMATLTEFFPEIAFATPTTLAGREGFRGRTVAVSISESPDLDALGLSGVHLLAAMADVARHVFARGGGVAYGGDLRPTSEGGLTQELFDLVGAYKGAEVLPDALVADYLAWPLGLDLAQNPRRKLALKRVARLEQVPPPPGLVARLNLDVTRPPEGDDATFVRARCLTEMRRKMTAETHARVVMGGKVTGYSGKYPGILEESHLAITAGQPLYLIGALGGCAAAVIEAVKGGKPAALTVEYQTQGRPGDGGWGARYASLINRYEHYRNDPDAGDGVVDYKAIVEDFNTRGVAGLNNGLDAAENEELFTSDNVDRIVFLLMKGLTARLADAAPPGAAAQRA